MAAGPRPKARSKPSASPTTVRGVAITVRKVAVGLATVAAAGLLWFASTSFLLIGTFIATAAAFLALIYLVRSRRRRAVALSGCSGPAWVASTREIGDIVADLELNSQLAEWFGHTAGPDGSARIVRTAMSPGQGAALLNRVDLKTPDGSTVTLVEKAVGNEGSELLLWRGTADTGLVLHTETYDVLEPLHQVDGGPVSVLYFPYLADLDRPRHVLRPEFRKNMHTIVSAIAELNGRNLIGSYPRLGNQPFAATRPTVAALKVRLDLRSGTARALQRRWDAAHDNWLNLRETYEQLPRCLCHNDVAPWNVVCRDGQVTTFADLGLSGTGPVGSDLHSVIRWSGKYIHDDAYIDDMLATYFEAVRPYVTTVSLADIRLAAWSTFFLRYTDLRFSSARHLHSYELAVRRMREL